MPITSSGMSSEDFFRFAHPNYNKRLYLALVFSVIAFPAIAVALVFGTIVLIVPLIALLLWIGSRTFFSFLLGNAVLVSGINYPRINDIVDDLKGQLGVARPVYIFIYESASFNAIMRYMFFRRAIFLNSETLQRGVSDQEIRWLVGRFIGYLRAREEAGVLGLLIRTTIYIPIFNFFILPFDRAMVYTGDRLALATMKGDINSAVAAVQKLFVGRELGYSLNPEGLIEQQRRIKGTFFGFLARVTTPFPHLTARFVDLIAFTRAFFPDEYRKCQAANPGLPADLVALAGWPKSHSSGACEGHRPGGARPRSWAVAFAVVGVVFVAGMGVYISLPSSPTIVVDRSPRGADRTSPTGYVPNPGCRWLNGNPRDLRVACD